MISTEVLLRHMAWSNQKVLARIAELPDEALSAYVSDPEWTVGKIIHHFSGSAGFYDFRLGGENVEHFASVSTMNDVKAILPVLAQYDAKLIAHASAEDRELTVQRDGQTIHWQFSTILSQAVHHATEHRAQIIQALDFRGFTGISLDDYDLWSYELMLTRGAN